MGAKINHVCNGNNITQKRPSSMVLIKQTAVCIKIPCIIYSFVYSVQLAGEAYVVAQTRWELCREVQVGVSSTKSNMVLNTQNKNMKSKSDL